MTDTERKMIRSCGRFKVKVHRYYEDENGLCQSWNGSFISEVYCIAPNQFLVYDPGNEESFGGFLWVNFEDVVPDCSDPDKYIPRVELYEGQK